MINTRFVKMADLRNYKFKCIRYGNCCYNVLRKAKIEEYGYNFRGEFVFNPLTSVTVFYTELPEMKKNLARQYNTDLSIVPQHALFMKNFKVGFIFQYQLSVRKKKYCKYYDITERSCKIYDCRPSSCRAYPLAYNPNNPTFPALDECCSGIDNELKRQFPDAKDRERSQFRIPEMINSCFTEFLIYQTSNEFQVSLLKLIMSNLGFLFLDSKILTPTRISEYELLDFSKFINWAKTHIKDKYILDHVNLFESQFEQLQVETALNLISWKNNPDEIRVPFRY